MPTLNTQTPHHFTFESDPLSFHILGGLSTHGLDRMRVTLKVCMMDNEFHALRHNIDLYHSHQVEKFVRRTAEFLEVGTTLVRKSLQALIHELESYRLNALDKEEEIEAEEYLLSKEERRQALRLLKSPALLKKTSELIGASGVIGEEVNRLLMYLIFSSRKTLHPLHCISFGNSGTGKTHLQSKVADLIPEEERIEMTMLSANALYYFKRHELKHKLIVIEDLDGADNVLYPLRELQSKRSITKSVVQKRIGGEGTTKQLTVEGPVCVSGCTTQEKLYEDNANRSFLLYIDESEAQDERIMHYQRAESAGRINKGEELQAVKLLRNAQRLLSPVSVRNPFAEYLILPKSVFKPRRTNAHYLQLIEVVTFYHQWQREKHYDSETGEEYIEATLEDIKQANDLIKQTLLRKSDPLNGATRNYLEILKTYLNKQNTRVFSNHEVRKELRIAESTLRRYHNLLLQEGFLKKQENKERQSFCYELVEIDHYQQMEKAIASALNQCVEKINGAN